MKTMLVATGAVAAILTGLATPAAAQRGYRDRPTNAQRDQNQVAAEVPRCRRNLGSVSIVNGENDGWVQYGLQPPARLLRVIIQRSGCFTIVDRAAGFDAAQRERDLSGDGQLQRGSNLGRGQVRSADYVLTAEVAAQDSNTGGGGVAGGLAGVLGGGRGGRALGGILGGVQTRRMEANTVLSLVDVRTSEQVASEEGYATRSNTSFNLGGGVIGGGAGGGAIGGGYDDTEVGRVVTAAFINAYSSMIMNIGGMSDAPAAAMAPREAFTTMSSVILRRGPDTRQPIVRTLPRGLTVYPTGQRQGMWWEVADDNDNIGWVRNDNLAPAR